MNSLKGDSFSFQQVYCEYFNGTLKEISLNAVDFKNVT